ncbi:hypothetical protein [Streptomyces rimosus]|uniref:hypothetical protein n=1 Tax=Streptomyces rimosus TaxID=1927 RepID=UPI000518F266|nr:hypothetical protein [Streptomyces rimosus]
MVTRAETSTEYVHVGVTMKIAGAPITASAPPKMAFLAGGGNPATSDWYTGEWAGSTARLLVGPVGGALTLTPGTYWVWLTWTAGAETPVWRSGQIKVI